ncbi:hypothetical protein KVV02_005034 [Mortierella alpina]|uniref:Uncharacterized protein n=1 Tax=Mortierella alpina TaxID=64518 RepID=A0A9P8CUV1_MORAP|nr:hypothetical protein KVV02_005034 [Mortierella alpina]
MSQAVDLSTHTRWTPDSYSESIAHSLDLDSSSAARWLDSDAIDTHLATQKAAAEAGRRHNDKTNSFADMLFSRADVVAGLIIICIGMLVLIVAVAVYFTNGRSWRSLRKATSEDRLSNRVIQEEENSDLESNNNIQQKAEHHDDTGPTDLKEKTGDTETTTVSEPSTPSTARLEDHPPPSRSIFAFLKGHSNPRPQRTCTTNTISDEPSSTSPSAAALVKHMPKLTRTKARSSSEQKRSGTHARGLFSPRMKAGKKTKDATAHPHRNGNHMNSTSATRSSSVMGLYGSARSSPNGSMVDAASTRAIYCASLKSAISFATTASQAQLLSGPCSEVMETDSKEIVLTTAVVIDGDTGSTTAAEA